MSAGDEPVAEGRHHRTGRPGELVVHDGKLWVPLGAIPEIFVVPSGHAEGDR